MDGTEWTPDLGRREGPLYRELADAIGAAIEEGRLGPGSRLPAQRALAERLAVALPTVTRGYAEAERRGLVRGEVGRGTYVRSRGGAGGEGGGGDRRADLRMNTLMPWPFGAELLDRAARLVTEADPSEFFAYGPCRGTRLQCEAGATLMGRVGLEASVERVVVTSGVQHGLVVVLASLANAGDAVLVEEVAYNGIRAVARVLGLRLVPVALDADGLDPESLEAAVRREHPKALVCTPTLQNPTSAVMSESRRAAIAGVLEASGIALIEDDSYGFALPDVVPLSSRVENAYYLVGMSKPLLPSLRVGYVRAPSTAAAERLEAVISATVIHCARPMADLAGEWIRDGTFDRVATWKRGQFRVRQETVGAILGRFDYVAHAKSPHGWLRLPDPWTAPEFVERAAAHGVLVTPAADFAVTRDAPHAVRLSVGPVPGRAMLADAARTLAKLLDDGPAAGEIVV